MVVFIDWRTVLKVENDLLTFWLENRPTKADLGNVMLLYWLLVFSSVLMWTAWGLIAMRAIAVSGILTREERNAGMAFMGVTYAIAMGLTHLIRFV